MFTIARYLEIAACPSLHRCRVLAKAVVAIHSLKLYGELQIRKASVVFGDST
jgi:hypothetical protein